MVKDKIKLTIPKKAEYISVARLAVSGVSLGLGFDIDSIEDLKVSIAEACINAFKLTDNDEIDIEFEVKRDSICTRVKDVRDISKDKTDEYKEMKMGLLIINSLMDEVKFRNSGIEMIKYIGADNNDYD